MKPAKDRENKGAKTLSLSTKEEGGEREGRAWYMDSISSLADPYPKAVGMEHCRTPLPMLIEGNAMRRRVIVGVFGATTGLTVTVFGPEGAREIASEDIPWTGNAKDGIDWPTGWLVESLDRLADSAQKGDVIALAMPGADVMIVSSDDADRGVPSNPIQHYRGVMDGGFIEQATESLPAETIYQRTHGANVAAFQPYAQLLAYRARHPGVLESAAEIVPLNDWMTLRLTGQRGHDPVMLQDQGLTLEGRQVCEQIAPWRVYGDSEALSTDASHYVMPVTHDSVPARMAGYSACPWVIWTGTWIGTACQVSHIQPTAELLQAGIAFEGSGESLSAITNVGMLGRTYKALVQKAGIGFDAASAKAMEQLGKIEVAPCDVAKLPVDEDHAIAELQRLYGSNDEELIACVIHLTARACHEKVVATAKLLNLPQPREVAVIGGWARNSAFIAALQQFFAEVKIPAQAPAATAVGMAAHALVGVGDAANVREALALLPELDN
jgi:sugar (pentulose or hexulose) kinase